MNDEKGNYRVRVLGTASVTSDGIEIPLTGNMRRTLSLIVAAGPSGLSIDRALTEATDGDGSEKAHSRIRMDVSRLRKRIGPPVLPNATGVWRLNIPRKNVDYFSLCESESGALPGSEELADLLANRAFDDAPSTPLINEARRIAATTQVDLLHRMLQQLAEIGLRQVERAFTRVKRRHIVQPINQVL